MSRQIWHVFAPNDLYFAGVVLASSAAEAREDAWHAFVASRKEDDQWRDYHASAEELVVRPLGDRYFGSDGHGRLEFDR